MNNLAKTFILLTVVLNTSALHAQTTSDKSRVDTLTVNVPQDTVTVDATLLRSVVLRRNNINPKTTNKDFSDFKYDPFKEKMKEPWINDILKDIFFR